MKAYRSGRQRALHIIEEAYAQGSTDLSGGVPSRYIATKLNIEKESVPRYLRPLVESGDLERVWGFGEDVNRPRRSYVPTEAER